MIDPVADAVHVPAPAVGAEFFVQVIHTLITIIRTLIPNIGTSMPAPAVGAEFFVQVRIRGRRRRRCWYPYVYARV